MIDSSYICCMGNYAQSSSTMTLTVVNSTIIHLSYIIIYSSLYSSHFVITIIIVVKSIVLLFFAVDLYLYYIIIIIINDFRYINIINYY